MRGVVSYDSIHGNTKRIAEAIAEEIKSEGHEAELLNVRESGKKEVFGDFLFIGSPTRMGRATREARGFVEGLTIESWENKPIIFFDTVGPLSKEDDKRDKWMERIDEGSKNAAKQLQELARKRGLQVYPKLLHSAVTGFLGPLAPDAEGRVKEFTREFLSTRK